MFEDKNILRSFIVFLTGGSNCDEVKNNNFERIFAWKNLLYHLSHFSCLFKNISTHIYLVTYCDTEFGFASIPARLPHWCSGRKYNC